MMKNLLLSKKKKRRKNKMWPCEFQKQKRFYFFVLLRNFGKKLESNFATLVPLKREPQVQQTKAAGEKNANKRLF